MFPRFELGFISNAFLARLNSDTISIIRIQYYVEKVKYLGFLLTCDLRDDIDMYRQLRYVYGTANRLRSKFSDCSKNVKNYLFRTFMYSFYGSSIWSSYRQSTFHRLRVSYNNAYRILFNLRRRVSISSTLVQNNIPVCTFQALF